MRHRRRARNRELDATDDRVPDRARDDRHRTRRRRGQRAAVGHRAHGIAGGIQQRQAGDRHGIAGGPARHRESRGPRGQRRAVALVGRGRHLVAARRQAAAAAGPVEGERWRRACVRRGLGTRQVEPYVVRCHAAVSARMSNDAVPTWPRSTVASPWVRSATVAPVTASSSTRPVTRRRRPAAIPTRPACRRRRARDELAGRSDPSGRRSRAGGTQLQRAARQHAHQQVPAVHALPHARAAAAAFHRLVIAVRGCAWGCRSSAASPRTPHGSGPDFLEVQRRMVHAHQPVADRHRRVRPAGEPHAARREAG